MDPRTSKQDIIRPQAGAILMMRGVMPAYKAAGPSVLTTCNRRGIVLGMAAFVGDMRRAWRRVLSTSNGDVSSAADVPLIAPLKKVTGTPSYPLRIRFLFQAS
jgi:hypothetical protein